MTNLKYPVIPPLKSTWEGGRAWKAQSIKHKTLNFNSGHDLMVPEFDPHTGCYRRGACLGFFLSAPSQSWVHTLLLSLETNNNNNNKKYLGEYFF